MHAKALFSCLATVGMLTLAGCVATRAVRPGADLARYGIHYSLRTTDEPRPNRIHILRVDLAASRVKPAALPAADPDGAGPAEAALTSPLELIRGRPVLAFVNTNPWDGLPESNGKPDRTWRAAQPVTISGLAVAGGVLRSQPERSVSIRFPKNGPPVMDDKGVDTNAVEAVAGFQQLIRDGVVLTKPAKPGEQLAPRTAIGLDEKGRTLWLVVVDGRQPGYSEGMNGDELSRLMKDLGCYQAGNMDGGGSSIMGLREADGAIRIVNSPSDRFLGQMVIRPLPLVLALEPADTKDAP